MAAALCTWRGGARTALDQTRACAKPTTISAGFYHTCALEDAGTVTCWGLSNWQQTIVPSGLGTVVSIAVGSDHTCALNDTGAVPCWGRHQFTSVPIAVPMTLPNTVTAIAAGSEHTCAVNNDTSTMAVGKVTCWGANTAGQSTVPPGLGTVVAISVGNSFSCALNNVGVVTCWGLNLYGETNVPIDLETVASISAGALHA